MKTLNLNHKIIAGTFGALFLAATAAFTVSAYAINSSSQTGSTPQISDNSQTGSRSQISDNSQTGSLGQYPAGSESSTNSNESMTESCGSLEIYDTYEEFLQNSPSRSKDSPSTKKSCAAVPLSELEKNEKPETSNPNSSPQTNSNPQGQGDNSSSNRESNRNSNPQTSSSNRNNDII